jgi:hypothetical protein
MKPRVRNLLFRWRARPHGFAVMREVRRPAGRCAHARASRRRRLGEPSTRKNRLKRGTNPPSPLESVNGREVDAQRGAVTAPPKYLGRESGLIKGHRCALLPIHSADEQKKASQTRNEPTISFRINKQLVARPVMPNFGSSLSARLSDRRYSTRCPAWLSQPKSAVTCVTAPSCVMPQSNGLR